MGIGEIVEMVEVLEGFLYNEMTMSICAYRYPLEKCLDKRHAGLYSGQKVVNEARKDSLTLVLETITPPSASTTLM